MFGVLHSSQFHRRMLVSDRLWCRTILKSRMLQPDVMRGLCAWEGGNCAAITVNNISRENITIRACMNLLLKCTSKELIAN